jgi:hypothetical protein
VDWDEPFSDQSEDDAERGSYSDTISGPVIVRVHFPSVLVRVLVQIFIQFLILF